MIHIIDEKGEKYLRCVCIRYGEETVELIHIPTLIKFLEKEGILQKQEKV